MAWDLVPVNAELDDYPINAWSWRPVLEMVRRSGLLDDGLIEIMGATCFAELTAEEAMIIASVIQAELRDLQGRRVMLDGEVRAGEDPGGFDRVDLAENYSVDVDVLESLCAFCVRSGGFVCW